MAEQTESVVQVVRIPSVDRHPNADKLEIINVNGYLCISQSGLWKQGDLAVYVPVDSMVPTDRAEFSFLKKGDRTQHRVKAMRLRGVFSMGLLVPPPPGFKEGDDVAEALGVTRYVPPSELKLNAHNFNVSAARMAKKAGGLKLPVYGLDPARKYLEYLQIGEDVVITEKIHGCNARFCYNRGRLWVGSHKVMRGCTRHRFTEALNRAWLKLKTMLGIGHRAHMLQELGDVWWQTAAALKLKERLALFPDHVLYGEIYGEGVQDLTYDSPKGRKFRAFDVFDIKNNKFLDWPDFLDFMSTLGFGSEDIVPVLYAGEWNHDVWKKFKQLSDTGDTTLSPPGAKPHLIEGVVIKPRVEVSHPHIGRLAFKYPGENYLLRKD
jgi:RNA ligase (TIGR02306 family)